MSDGGVWPADDRGLFPRGTILNGQYEITGYIGRGAFGTVYEGRQSSIRRPVAIKVLMPNTDPTVRDRFMREARTAAAIAHPNVVTIHEFGVHDNAHPFIVMERLEGWALEEALRREGPMDLRRALALFLPCLEALAEAHRLGIVHKDLKPSNLFLTHPGTRREALLIVDFGVARITGEAEAALKEAGGGETLPGQAVGTPPYMAPEYIERQIVTPALDVYQMGLILCEALSGRQVVPADVGWSALVMHVSGDLDIPSVVLEDEALRPILFKALDKDHTRRYPDAGALMKALEDLAQPSDLDAEDPWDAPTIKASSPLIPDVDPLELDTVEMLPSAQAEIDTLELHPSKAVVTNTQKTAPVGKRSSRWLLFGGGAFGVISLAVVVLAILGVIGWSIWGGKKPKTPAKPPEVVKEKPKGGKGARIRISKLSEKALRKRIKKTDWDIFRVDHPESIKGVVFTLTKAGRGASVMHYKAKNSGDAEAVEVSMEGLHAVVREGRWIMMVTVPDDLDDAEVLMDQLLRP